MNNYIDNLKKRLIYRSQYRGTKEMDKLVGSFVKNYINNFDEKDLKELEIFLNYDDDFCVLFSMFDVFDVFDVIAFAFDRQAKLKF